MDPYSLDHIVLPSSFAKNTKNHGGKGIRTLDPLLAKQVLSHLSYTPMGIAAYVKVSLAGTLKIEQS